MAKQVISPGRLTLTVEANTPGALARLLEQALYELKEATPQEDNGFEPIPFSTDAVGSQSGTLGSYSFNFESAQQAVEADY